MVNLKLPHSDRTLPCFGVLCIKLCRKAVIHLSYLPCLLIEGDRNGSYMAGECAGMVRRIEPAKAIVEDPILGAEKVMRSVASKFEE